MSAWVPVSLSTSALATLIEIETEEDGRLPLTSITPILPGTTALKFCTLGNQAFSGEVPVEEGNFLAPEGGWGVSKMYIAINRVVEEEPNPPKALSIPHPDASDNDILVIDISDSEEVEGPEGVERKKNAIPEHPQQITNECAQRPSSGDGSGMLTQYWEWATKNGLTFPKKYKKSIFTTDSVSTPAIARVIWPSTTSSNFQQAGATNSVVAVKSKDVGAWEGQVGVWKFAKRCHEAKNTSSGQKFLGPRCQVMCPNLNQPTARPCHAMLALRNLEQHIKRNHNVIGCIDKLRCPDCDELVSAESLQHHVQQLHKTCNNKCMSKCMSSTKSRISATVSASTSSSVQVQDQSFLSTYSTYLTPKNPSHPSTPKNLPGALTAGAQLPVRVIDKKRPSSHAIWVRKDIFRPEVFAHKS